MTEESKARDRTPRARDGISDPDFEALKAAYPQRTGGQEWPKARRALNARLREGETIAEILAGTKRYAAHVEAKGDTGSRYVKQAATFYGPDKHFREPWAAPQTRAELRTARNHEAARQAIAEMEAEDRGGAHTGDMNHE